MRRATGQASAWLYRSRSTVGARLIGFAIIGVVCILLMLVGVYVLASARTPKRPVEMDVSTRPSMWWADTRSIKDNTVTEVSIVRVDSHSREVLERRILEYLPNDSPDYVNLLDAAQDRAYDAGRKANLGLNRR